LGTFKHNAAARKSNHVPHLVRTPKLKKNYQIQTWLIIHPVIISSITEQYEQFVKIKFPYV